MPSLSRRGFTLIELLVVIAIIGILSAVILTAVNTARAKSFDAKRVSDIREVQKALELYSSSNGGVYPSTSNAWYSQCTISGVSTQPASNVIPNLISSGAISSVPADPEMKASSGTCCYLYKSNGTDYKFMVYNCPTANYSNPVLASLVDPGRTGPSLPSFAWAVYSLGASAW